MSIKPLILPHKANLANYRLNVNASDITIFSVGTMVGYWPNMFAGNGDSQDESRMRSMPMIAMNIKGQPNLRGFKLGAI